MSLAPSPPTAPSLAPRAPTLGALQHLVAACTACPRLVAYRQQVAARRKREFAGWNYWGRPVAGFGDPSARLLLVGLAPAAHGANRTGRMFTGDGAAQFLVAALHRAGFANQPTSTDADDGLQLHDAYMTAGVRCAPPDNRPTMTERRTCFPFLERERQLLPRVRVMMALGRVAFDTCRWLLRPLLDPGTHPALAQLEFRHGAVYRWPTPGIPILVASYHPSRQNTQTGRLTPAMMDAVLETAHALLDAAGDVTTEAAVNGPAGPTASRPAARWCRPPRAAP